MVNLSTNDMKNLRKPFFERGDIILDLKKENPRLILSVTDNEKYEFMELVSHYFKDVFGNPIDISKGDVSTQPIDIVEKNFCIYKIE